MKSMMENLESRTLLSAAPVSAWFVPMQTAAIVAPLTTVYTSPVGRYTGTSTGTESGPLTWVIQSWNTTAGTMHFKALNPANGSVTKGTATISGRRFTCSVQVDPTRITTFTGKVAADYASGWGTWVTKNLRGVVKGSGTYSFSR